MRTGNEVLYDTEITTEVKKGRKWEQEMRFSMTQRSLLKSKKAGNEVP